MNPELTADKTTRSLLAKMVVPAERNCEKGVTSVPKRRRSMARAVILVVLLASVPARAQSTAGTTAHFDQNAAYVEALGVGGLYSINYDRRITRELGFRAGFTTWSLITGFPVMANLLLGSNPDYVEIWFGALIGFTTPEGKPFFSSYANPGPGMWVGTLGFRYQPDSGGIVFRVDFTPLFWNGGIVAGIAV